MSENSVHLQPLIGWPKNVHRGDEHLVTVDFRLHEESGEWPYEAEEVALTCVLDGGSAFRVESVDDNTVIVHRFGGTYSPTRFVVRATPFADLGLHRLALTVMSERGAVLRSDVLGINVLTDQEHGPGDESPRTPELLPRSTTVGSRPGQQSTSRTVAADRRPFFYFSYAPARFRPEDSDRWVVKFFNDLCHDLGQSTGALNPGFMDRTVRVGDEWHESTRDALGNCRVLVALFSPAYFTSEYCGREWGAFLERYSAQAEVGRGPAPIIPVLWTPLAAEQIPESLRSIQSFSPSLPSAYATEGIYGLMKLARHREQYKETVLRLAHLIKECADECALDPGSVPDMISVRNPFEHSPGVSTRPSVRVVLAALDLDRIPPERDTYYYGRTPLEWSPFRSPDETRPLAEIVRELLDEVGYRCTVESADEQSHSPPGAPTLVIADPWVVRDDTTRDRLRQLVHDFHYFTPLYNADDEQTREAVDDLHAGLLGLFAPEIEIRNSVPRMTSADEFRRNFGEVVENVLARYLRRGKVRLPDHLAISRAQLFLPDD